MDLLKGKDKAIEILNNVLRALKELPGNFIHKHLPVGKKQRLFFAVGGFTCLFLILLVVILAVNMGGAKKSPETTMAAGPVVPADELFIPAEPDFVPEFLLERNPRSFWSVDDVRPYWRNPGSGTVGSDWWRGAVKSAVDELMEGVP